MPVVVALLVGRICGLNEKPLGTAEEECVYPQTDLNRQGKKC